VSGSFQFPCAFGRLLRGLDVVDIEDLFFCAFGRLLRILVGREQSPSSSAPSGGSRKPSQRGNALCPFSSAPVGRSASHRNPSTASHLFLRACGPVFIGDFGGPWAGSSQVPPLLDGLKRPAAASAKEAPFYCGSLSPDRPFVEGRVFAVEISADRPEVRPRIR